MITPHCHFEGSVQLRYHFSNSPPANREMKKIISIGAFRSICLINNTFHLIVYSILHTTVYRVRGKHVLYSLNKHIPDCLSTRFTVAVVSLVILWTKSVLFHKLSLHTMMIMMSRRTLPSFLRQKLRTTTILLQQ